MLGLEVYIICTRPWVQAQHCQKKQFVNQKGSIDNSRVYNLEANASSSSHPNADSGDTVVHSVSFINGGDKPGEYKPMSINIQATY